MKENIVKFDSIHNYNFWFKKKKTFKYKYMSHKQREILVSNLLKINEKKKFLNVQGSKQAALTGKPWGVIKICKDVWLHQ